MKTPPPPFSTTPSPIAPLLAADGYKMSHRLLYPEGTTRILINWTNRSNKLTPLASHAVHFGLQAYLQRSLIEAWAPFFAADEDEVAGLYDDAMLAYFGPNTLGSEHVRALHRLGYLPLEVRALREGTLVPFGVPTLVVENTHDDFFWLPNYIETDLSAAIWHPSTTATTALILRELADEWAHRTGGDPASVDFQMHDFSLRGQTSIESGAASGAGHLTSFLGTDTLPALDWIDRYYRGRPGENDPVGLSVPATEHSVMSARGPQGEQATFERILDVFPTGIVSAVSDTYDLWHVLTDTLPALKDRILARDGKLVIRPDSGDPVDIITGTLPGYSGSSSLTAEEKGVVELLWDVFGGTTNEAGFKVLDSHIGVIYGDSINLERAAAIFERLARKGFASTNVVLGVGSFTYQFTTRDALGSAVKATWALVDGKGVDIWKDPVTGASKKSAKGRLAVQRRTDGELELVQQATPADEEDSLLTPVWRNGRFLRHQSFGDVRATLAVERSARAARVGEKG